MTFYVIRRLILLLPTVLGVSLIVFVILRAVPGDVAVILLEGEARPDVVEAIRKQYGLDKPLHIQYIDWLMGVLQGDFGTSYWYKTPIAKNIAKAYPVTLELAFMALLISMVIAFPTGILSAIKQDTWVDYLLRVVTITGLAAPGFWLGILTLLMLSRWFHYVPPFGYVGFWQDPWKNLQQYIWPALILGFGTSAVLSRMVRSQMLEVLREDYIRTARAKGLHEGAVIIRHAMKNMMLPVITLMGLQVGFLLGGTVVLERIFVLPGMGTVMVEGIQHRDYVTVQGSVLLIATTFVLLNLIVDLLYAWLDPRIRYN